MRMRGTCSPTAKERASGRVRFEEQLPLAGFFFRGTVARQVDAGALREELQRVDEFHSIALDNKVDRVSTGLAAVAVKELPGSVDGKRGRLLLVKWTKAGKILRPGFLQLHVIADHADDVRLRLYEFLEICGVWHSGTRIFWSVAEHSG